MEKSKKIYLVGLPGAGKSTLGKELAEYLGYVFADLDSEIENAAGMTIPEYFIHQGEGNFRIMEKETLHSFASKHDSFVLATGGGTPCFHYNMDFMNETGLTIFLDVSAGDLALRILDQGVENRPLFKSYDHQDLIQEVRDLAENRMDFYNQAQIKIRDNRITLDKIISYL
ncbi:MAG: shikimate kinase [Cytophagales bacterium CG12_big_fil_rev_8_21_14_0_65_40_12]|nr:MAG: shikimate kinase [Cytophagales bacterium CG12_big_fil_rev_8_21_14_0_65_40_12]PIW06229.1 MAG: shikimate kinase [Cytophagales bacterium CG17_big_fil_post_rev_8_21_14_2_50_40_13]